MRVDASGGVLEERVTMNAGQDLFLTGSVSLLVGSRGIMAPRIYSQELDMLAMTGLVIGCAVVMRRWFVY